MRRVIGAALAASAIFAATVVTLSQRVPDIVETPLAVSEPAALIPQYKSLPVELIDEPSPPNAAIRAARLPLRVGDPSRLLQSNAIELLVTRYFTDPRLVKAELLVPAAGCAYQSLPGATEFPSNALLLMRRLGECRPANGPLQLEFVVTYEGVGHFAVWAFEPLASVDRATAVTPATSDYPPGAPAPALRGYYASDRGLSTLRRVDLLSYMWTGRIDASNVWGDVALAWLATMAGLTLVWSGTPLRSAAGVALAAGAIALAYSVVVPPFQAPDEPTHLWGYAQLVDDAALAADIESVVKRTHFTRLRFWQFEKFRPADATAPSDVGWLDPARQEPHRSATFPRIARLVHSVAPPASAASALRFWRRVGVLLFALGFLAAALLFGQRAYAVMPILIVPALPYLTVALSNYSLLNAAFVVVAGAVVLLGLDDDSPAAGIGLGAGFAIAAASARSALAAVPLLAACVSSRLVLNRYAPGTHRWRFWAGLAFGSAIFILVAAGPYLRYLAELARMPTSAMAVLVAAVGAALAVMAVAEHRRVRTSGPPSALLDRVLRAGCWTAAAVIASGIVASATATLPTVPFLAHGAPTAPAAYVKEVLESAVVPFRAAQQDFMLSTTFWGAFGWMNLPLPDGVLGVLSVLTGLALAVQLVFCARRGSFAECVWAVALLGGTFASLLACAALAVLAQADVHGRYTMGIYLPVVLYAFSGPASRHAPRAIAAAACLAGLVQAYSLYFLAERYF